MVYNTSKNIIIISFSLIISLGVILNYNYVNYIDKYFYKIHLWTLFNEKGFLIFRFFTYLGDGHLIFALLLVIGIISTFKRSIFEKFVLLFVIFTVSKNLNSLLKNIFDRPRPTNEYLLHAEGWSFPSGHTMNATSFYLSIILINILPFRSNLLKCFLIFIVLMVGISRVALGVHFPTDVIGGWLFGLIIIFTCNVLYEKSIGKSVK